MVRKTALQKLSILEIRELLDEKISEERKKLPGLIEKRDRLQSDLDGLNREIEVIGEDFLVTERSDGKPRKTAKKRSVKKGAKRASGGDRVTLPAAMESILSDSKSPMSPVEIAEKLTEMKHPSAKSKSLRTQISVALSKRPEFKRVGRGQYTVK